MPHANPPHLTKTPPPNPTSASEAGGASVPAEPQPAETSAAVGASAAPPARRRVPERRRAFLHELGDLIRRLYQKAGQDNIFFISGAIAFNVLVAIVPLILAALAIAGMALANRSADPAGAMLRYINEALPGALSVAGELREGLNQVISQSGGLLSLSTLVFVWFATRLVGTLRTALREIFDVHQDRGIIRGKIFDIQMVLAAGTLLTVNVALTVVIRVLAERGIDVLGLDPASFESWTRIYLAAAGVLSLWFMFVLIYRYLPGRRIPWRISVISATFTTVFFELMKAAFSWYVSSMANYRSAYGNFATFIVLFLWIYYMAVAFVLGGEFGQVTAQRHARRRQKERLG
jgi:membrane protein